MKKACYLFDSRLSATARSVAVSLAWLEHPMTDQESVINSGNLRRLLLVDLAAVSIFALTWVVTRGMPLLETLKTRPGAAFVAFARFLMAVGLVMGTSDREFLTCIG